MQARTLAATGAAHGTVVIAEEQTAGRGRLGRRYCSPRGGVWFTVVLRPALAPAEASVLSLLAGLAVAEAVAAVSAVRVLLKWPNDLLYDGRKLCGILTELEAEENLVHAVLLGIGINVNLTRESLPLELRDTSTSLLLAGGAMVSRRALTQHVLQRLEVWLGRLECDGPAPILAAWRAWPNMLGHRVQVTQQRRILNGIAQDLDETGALLVRGVDGTMHRVLAGEVTLNFARGASSIGVP
jgi:BirA family biotin operon repressor/biotin-[acetyl-CoA-carboxylase] ligase